MDNIYINGKEDLDKLIELLDEYSTRLKKLIMAYRNQKRTQLMYLSILSFFMIIFFLGLYYFTQIQTDYSIRYESVLYLIIPIATLVYFSLYYLRGRRNDLDIRDETILIYKKLSQLIKITSQTREHIISVSDISLLAFDLKLTEAEDSLERAEKVFYLKKRETNANNV